MKLLIKLFGPIVSQLLSLIGYTTGSFLNTSAAVAADTAKGAIDIAEGTIQNGCFLEKQQIKMLSLVLMILQIHYLVKLTS